MFSPNDNTASSRSVLMRFLVRSREYRYPHVWVRVALPVASSTWSLAVLLLTSGPWLGPLAWLGVLPLAGAALIFWTAYRLQISIQT